MSEDNIIIGFPGTPVGWAVTIKTTSGTIKGIWLVHTYTGCTAAEILRNLSAIGTAGTNIGSLNSPGGTDMWTLYFMDSAQNLWTNGYFGFLGALPTPGTDQTFTDTCITITIGTVGAGTPPNTTTVSMQVTYNLDSVPKQTTLPVGNYYQIATICGSVPLV